MWSICKRTRHRKIPLQIKTFSNHSAIDTFFLLCLTQKQRAYSLRRIIRRLPILKFYIHFKGQTNMTQKSMGGYIFFTNHSRKSKVACFALNKLCISVQTNKTQKNIQQIIALWSNFSCVMFRANKLHSMFYRNGRFSGNIQYYLGCAE